MNKLFLLGFLLAMLVGVAESKCCTCDPSFPCPANASHRDKPFCCNCAGFFCRRSGPVSTADGCTGGPGYCGGPSRVKRSEDDTESLVDGNQEYNGMDIVMAADLDGNDMLDFDEVVQYLHTRNKRNAEDNKSSD